MARLALLTLLFVAVIVERSYALDCFGTTCNADQQFCQVIIIENRGECYTHHGQGHHEDHQMCMGTHHPDDHCFCSDQACVDEMVKQLANASTAPPSSSVASG